MLTLNAGLPGRFLRVLWNTLDVYFGGKRHAIRTRRLRSSVSSACLKIGLQDGQCRLRPMTVLSRQMRGGWETLLSLRLFGESLVQ